MFMLSVDVDTSMRNKNLMGSLVSSRNGSQPTEVLVQAFGVIVEQLACSDVTSQHIDRVIASYVYLHGRVPGISFLVCSFIDY